MKNNTLLPLATALSMALPSFGSAADALVNDTFDAASLGKNWTAFTTPGAKVGAADGKIAIDIGATTNQFRALIARDADDAGATTAFDFYSRPLTVQVELGALGGEGGSSGAAVFYYLGVGSDAEGGPKLFPVDADDGCFVAVKRIRVKENATFDQLWTIRKVGGEKTEELLGSLNGTLAGIGIAMKGNSWTIDLQGATLAGKNSATASFEGIGKDDFDKFTFSVGTWNSGDVGNGGSMEIDGIEITAGEAE